MKLEQWAQRWGVSAQAVEELRAAFGVYPHVNTSAGGPGSEAAVQTLIRLEATKKGCRLWRNNVGATTTDDGSFIRYGLANDSSTLNKQVKSSDLIGIRPVRIESGHVGMVVGQFVAREVKAANWKWRGTEREQAQLRFMQIVASMGGDAMFTNGEGSI